MNFVNTAAVGFPPSLSGVIVGTAVSGTIRYEATTPPASNGFPAPFGLATRYQPAGMTVSLNIGGVTMNTWSGPFTAFVWNNDPIQGPIVDGLLYQNLASPGATILQIGNFNLPIATFAKTPKVPIASSGRIVLIVVPELAANRKVSAPVSLRFIPAVIPGAGQGCV